MTLDITRLDIASLAWFFLVWGGFTLVFDHPKLSPATLNRHMETIRRVWMRNMLERENRIMDSQLLGHLISSVSFFASTTVLVLAGLLGALAAAENAHRVVNDLGFVATSSAQIFEAKILLLLAIFVYAFFRFTWAVRQYNYACALIGAAPAKGVPGGEEVADEAAVMLSLAVLSFNGGIRAYYFAFAVLGWFVHPLIFIGCTAWVTLILLRRQFSSPAARVAERYGMAIRDPGGSEKS